METTLSTLLKEKGTIVHSVSPIVSAYECALKLTHLRVGALLVMENNSILGIISERDILAKAITQKNDLNNILVKDIMTKELITALPSTTVKEAMRTITENRVRHLPVFDAGKLLGIISIGDLMRWIMISQEKEISILTSYICGEK